MWTNEQRLSATQPLLHYSGCCWVLTAETDGLITHNEQRLSATQPLLHYSGCCWVLTAETDSDYKFDEKAGERATSMLLNIRRIKMD